MNEDIPYIEKVIWEIIESTDTFLLQFRSGGLDSVSVYPEFFRYSKKKKIKGILLSIMADPITVPILLLLISTKERKAVSL